MSWPPGAPVVRRQIVHGRPWLGWVVNVVEDTPEILATYSAEGSPFHFPDGDWPTPDGLHPWRHLYRSWQGNGVLMVQRPGDPYAVWHFWDGPDRAFRCWYINFETPFERTEIGFDTQDHELDIVIEPGGSWEFKDVDMLWQRHDEGRFTRRKVERILELGDEVGRTIDSGDWWWDRSWTRFVPNPTWVQTEIPSTWAAVSTNL